MRAAAIALAVIVAGLALLMRGGISARTPPSHFESVIARRLRNFAIRDSARLRNPVPPSREVFDAGRAHFADHCAICHANDGSGDTELGRNLYPRAPDLRLPATQHSPTARSSPSSRTACG